MRLEGEGLEGVAGEDGDGFAEDDVAGGLAAAEVVVVERGEVVVNEGVGMDHFEGCAEFGCALRECPPCRRSCVRLPCEDGAEAFAAGEDAVAHGAMDGVRQSVGRGQETFESSVGELDARVQQVLYGGSHLMLMINQRCSAVRRRRGSRTSAQGEGGECCEEIADALVGERGVGDLDVCGTGGKRDGDEAVLSVQACGEEGAVA